MDDITDSTAAKSSPSLPPPLKTKLNNIKGKAPNLFFKQTHVNNQNDFNYDQDNDKEFFLISSESLNNTWLDTPKRGKETHSDWLEYKEKLPNNKSRKSLVPPGCHPSPHPLPFSFTDEKTREFIDGKNLSVNNVIKLTGNACKYGASLNISSSARQKTLAFIEKLLREALGELMGITSLLKYMFETFGSLINMPSRQSSHNEFDLFQNILFVVITSLLRSKDLLASSIVRLRELLRELTLEKLYGKFTSNITKMSLKYSDFGHPLLFGPVRDEVEALVSPSVHGPTATEFQLSLGSQKPYALKGAPKKKGKFTPHFSRSASTNTHPPPNQQGSVFPKGQRNRKRKKNKVPPKPIVSKDP